MIKFMREPEPTAPDSNSSVIGDEVVAELRVFRAEIGELRERVSDIELKLSRYERGPGEIASYEGNGGSREDFVRPVMTVGDVIERVLLLSERESEVFGLLGEGASNRSISTSLGITERTVKAHVGQVLNKLGLQSRAQASIVAFALMIRAEGTRQGWASAVESAILSQ